MSTNVQVSIAIWVCIFGWASSTEIPLYGKYTGFDILLTSIVIRIFIVCKYYEGILRNGDIKGN